MTKQDDLEEAVLKLSENVVRMANQIDFCVKKIVELVYVYDDLNKRIKDLTK